MTDSPVDITLDGRAYRLAPGGYERRPESVQPNVGDRQQLSSFGAGLGIAQDDEITGDQEGGWSGLAVGPVGRGSGVAPFPNIVAFNDSFTPTPELTSPRAHGGIAGNKAYVAIGRYIYESVALDAGTWSAWNQVCDLGSAFSVSGLAYYQDDFLVMLSTGQDIRKFNTGSGALTVWRTGEAGRVGVGYAGQLIYAPLEDNAQDELRLSGTKWNGNAVTHFRYLDSPIVNMALYDSEVVIATKTSLYRMGGQPYPGEADDASVGNDTSRAPEWRGDPEPLLTHGIFASGDDFIFLASFRGRLYTWLAGRVMEYSGGEVWTPMGPQGVNCYGGCVSGDWLLVAITTRAGESELWGFDGTGWWCFMRQASPTLVWPTPLGGAGNRDVVVFGAGSNDYDLVRLRWRSTSVHTYAASGQWVSPLLTARDPGTDKAWRRVDAWFAWPDIPGNPASEDSATIALDASLDAGATWTEIATETVTVGREQHLSHQFTTPPTSRTLQLRVRWSSVSDWSPVLTHIDVDFAALDTSPRRQRWTLQLQVRDQLAASGRPDIDALWEAWREPHVLFRDIDYDTTPAERTVRVMEIEERAPEAPGSSQEWGGGIVSVMLSEL